MFLNPWLLAGVGGIAVPIVIHLLNRRNFRPVVWAAMRFIQVSMEKNRRRMIIEELLLLVLRCVIVALLAVALARPAILHGGASGGIVGPQPAIAVLLLDNSSSMGKSDGVQTRFERATKAADDIVAGLPPGSSVAVMVLAEGMPDPIPQPTTELKLVRQVLSSATLTNCGTGLLAGLKRASAALAASTGANKRIYVVTDLQANSWGNDQGLSPELLRLLEEQKKQVRIIFIPDDDTRNLQVSDMRLATELPTPGKALRFEVEVTNDGPQEVRDVPVRLYVDEGPNPVDEGVIASIPARSARSLSLHGSVSEDGYHVIRARLTPDRLPADDERAYVIRALREVQVLLVNGESGQQAQDEDVFFLRNALQPVSAEERGSWFIKTQTISASELDQAPLEKFDAIMLANVAEVSRTTIARLERLVGQGHGLVLFPGPHINAEFYRDVLYRHHGLVPAWPGEARGDADGDRFETLQPSGFSHPITAFWNEEGHGNPAAAHFFRSFDITIEPRPTTWPATDSPPGPTSIVAAYASGKPAIVEHSFGQGRVVLFGSTANTRWNDLPAHGSLFVPLMHRVLDSLLQRPEYSLNLVAGQRLTLTCAGEMWGKEAQVTRPAAAGGTQEFTRVEMVNNVPKLIYPNTDVAGVYRIALDGAAPGDPAVFAVHADPAESDLRELLREQLAALGQRAAVSTSGEDQLLEDRGTELWRLLVTVLVVMAVVESLLAFWFGRVK